MNRPRVIEATKLACVVGIFTVIATTGLFAEIMSGASPEWMAHKAALIFVGVPQKTEVKHLRGDRWITRVQFRIEKRIKGPLSVGDFVTVHSLDWKGKTDQMDLAGAVTKKRSALVTAEIAEGTFSETDGHYQFLSFILTPQCFYSDEPVKWVYAETGHAIRAFDVLLKRIEQQVAKETEMISRGWRGKILERAVNADGEADAFKELYAGSSVSIRTIEYKDQ